MRPRTFGKIAVTVLMICSIGACLAFVTASPDNQEIYKAFRGITYAILSLTFATLLRYFED
jgi:hypothetical protein